MDIPQLRLAKKKPANGRLLITEHPVMSFVNRIGRTNFIVLVLEASSFALSSGTGVPPVCFCPATATTFAAIHGRDARATTPAATCIRSNTRPGFVKELSLFGQQLSLRRHFQIGLGLYAVTRRLQNQPVVTGEGGGLEFLRT